MKRIQSIESLREQLMRARESQKVIGLVPTMGALHEGHMSLVERARQMCDVVVVSLFVNPTQFNEKKDLETYPRTPDEDAARLEEAGVDFTFEPTVEEIYPEEDTRVFDLGSVAEVMEGALRPGHFNGVCQVVSRLFDIVEPKLSFFGEKDFQQVAVLKKMLELTRQPVEIVVCPIVREADGLAKSSRNVRLSPDGRTVAPHIYEKMLESIARKSELNPKELAEAITNELNKEELLDVEYYSIADGATLQPIGDWSDSAEPRGFIAVYCSGVRLIDNIAY